MVLNADDETIDDLSQYSIADVHRHDEWSRESLERDVSSTVDVVAKYYHRLFDLQSC
ncbi:hypothetical protein C440_00330 [Haloferax mucosum ATCC BAA-1512]|uniref:Uncharacterized protein n=1 Tax=Haloferax mucosum ATCC BAA-1512 TaxID=662479 RepID=M0IPK1_9EURY|nr:hypothetical protein [Haloferax mucosum]ELZ98756.1 hypothetical protein C440_00330 [Haloferax mucosum ATCC BAA-1512]